jgi:hypothetical protein
MLWIAWFGIQLGSADLDPESCYGSRKAKMTLKKANIMDTF